MGTIQDAIGICQCNRDAQTGKVLSHFEIWGRAIAFLGGVDAVAKYIPFSADELQDAYLKDQDFNNLPLSKWQRAAGFKADGPNCEVSGDGLWDLYLRRGISSASCSEGVSLLKTAARLLIEREHPEMSAMYGDVVVGSRKYGGQLLAYVVDRQTAEQVQANGVMPGLEDCICKIIHFASRDTAERACAMLNNAEISIKRIRPSVTQGEVRVYVNGDQVAWFGDTIVLTAQQDPDAEFYGPAIGGWQSKLPDSCFVLPLIWDPGTHAGRNIVSDLLKEY